jgi:hypothetical protein
VGLSIGTGMNAEAAIDPSRKRRSLRLGLVVTLRDGLLRRFSGRRTQVAETLVAVRFRPNPRLSSVGSAYTSALRAKRTTGAGSIATTVQSLHNVTDVVGREEMQARFSRGGSILIAGICDRLRRWTETLPHSTKVEVSGASAR